MNELPRVRFIVERADSGMQLRSASRGVVVLAGMTLLAGCLDHDRVLGAHCQVASDALVAVTFSSPGAPQPAMGGLNSRQDELGTLFHFVPHDDRDGRARGMTVHTLVTQAIDVSHEMYWNSLSLHARLKMDLDGAELPLSSRASLESALLSGSGVIAWDVERQTIRDVLQAIDGDPRALSILQGAAPEDRYLVISSRLLAKYVRLRYTPGGGIWLSDGRGSASTPFIAPLTFRIGNTNFHSDYSCAPVDELNSAVVARQARVPAVYFYTAVRYDAATKKAQQDLRVNDLYLLTATVRAAQIQR
jgi:hypothetical protein